MAKRYDVVAVVGQYQDRETGQMKPQRKNVGAVVETNNGGLVLLLDKTFNPAGLAEADKPSIMLSLFEPRQKPSESHSRDNPPNQGEVYKPANPMPSPHDDLDDDIPF